MREQELQQGEREAKVLSFVPSASEVGSRLGVSRDSTNPCIDHLSDKRLSRSVIRISILIIAVAGAIILIFGYALNADPTSAKASDRLYALAQSNEPLMIASAICSGLKDLDDFTGCTKPEHVTSCIMDYGGIDVFLSVGFVINGRFKIYYYVTIETTDNALLRFQTKAERGYQGHGEYSDGTDPSIAAMPVRLFFYYGNTEYTFNGFLLNASAMTIDAHIASADDSVVTAQQTRAVAANTVRTVLREFRGLLSGL